MSELSHLSHARYGKDKVRVLRVVRDGAWHNIVEYNVTALVEGNIDIRSVFVCLVSAAMTGLTYSYIAVIPRPTTPWLSRPTPVRTFLILYLRLTSL